MVENELKYYLFLDTSHQDVIVGLLDEHFRWIEYKKLLTKKPSEVLHGALYEVTEKHRLKLKSVTAVFASAGPGSYTGMRLSEGIVQVIAMLNKPIYSFYHFEVPKFFENKNFQWWSNAFKGEYFCYRYKNGNEEIMHFSKEGFQWGKEKSMSLENFSEEVAFLDLGCRSCIQEIYERPHDFFEMVKNRNLKFQPYYYRSIDEEFKI